MKFLKSLIDYSGIALIYLQFSILFQLKINFVVQIIVVIFIAYSFVTIINADKSGKKMRLPLILCIALIPIIILFRIQHWPGAAFMFLIACTGLSLSYFLRFIFKPKRSGMDLVKLSVVVSFCVMILFNILRWPYSEEVGYLSLGVSVVGYILYMFSKEVVIITHERILPRTTINIDEIQASEVIGCYECGTIYNNAADVNYDGATAICPNCEKSTLIGSSKYNVTAGSLATLKKEFARNK